MSPKSLVEGILSGNNVIGFDVDPLSVLISKVKTTQIETNYLKSIQKWLLNEISTNIKVGFVPDCDTINHWFTIDAINKLSVIRTAIDNIPLNFGQNKAISDIQDLMIVCFSSIIRKVSLADNQSQKTYVSHTKIKKPKEVYYLFRSQLEYFVKNIIQFSKESETNLNNRVICSSSIHNLNTILSDTNLDLIITSPPYIKAIDYIYNQMVELFWVGDLFEMQTQSKQNKRKSEYIGNKYIKKKEYDKLSPNNLNFDINNLDNQIQSVYNNDKINGHKHSYIIFKYFTEMEKHFQELAKYTKEGTHYIMVVGDSMVSNIHIETANILTTIAEKNGFSITNSWGYKIKNRFMRFDRKGRGGLIVDDNVLDFVRV